MNVLNVQCLPIDTIYNKLLDYRKGVGPQQQYNVSPAATDWIHTEWLSQYTPENCVPSSSFCTTQAMVNLYNSIRESIRPACPPSLQLVRPQQRVLRFCRRLFVQQAVEYRGSLECERRNDHEPRHAIHQPTRSDMGW